MSQTAITISLRFPKGSFITVQKAAKRARSERSCAGGMEAEYRTQVGRRQRADAAEAKDGGWF